MNVGDLPQGRLRRLALALVVVVVPPALTLIWLGAQWLERDRTFLERNERDRRSALGADVASVLRSSLADAEKSVTAGPVPQGASRLTLTSLNVVGEPRAHLLWNGRRRPLPQTPSESFFDAEVLEEGGHEDQALAIYRQRATSTDPAVRAGALVRVARVYRRRHGWEAAIAAYRTLSTITAVDLEGVPADLLARRGLCAMLREAGRREDLAREAHALALEFVGGRWSLDRSTWQWTAAELEEWTGGPLSVPEEARAVSEAQDALLAAWPELSHDAAPRARRLVVGDTVRSTVLLQTDADQVVALVITPATLRSWAIRAAPRSDDGAVALTDEAGRVLAGRATAADAPALTLKGETTELPWTIVVGGGDPSTVARELLARSRLLAAGLGAVLLLLGGGGYFLWRVVQQEMTVARQQTAFVSAVSHEFRTPLTSFRHITELLQEGDEMPVARRQTFYAALARNTERLHRLVESLLDFSRLDSGRWNASLTVIEIGPFVERVVEEFRHSLEADRATITTDTRATPPLHVRADAGMLATALWNLLDNAVKYSSPPAVVRVSVCRQAADAEIAVTDSGFGIPAAERTEIFRRFVRGERALELRITGTGLGLTMVSEIARMHRGRVELESRESAGSTFRIVLPMLQRAAVEAHEPTGAPSQAT